MSRWSIAGAWVLVAALATTLTWQIVSAADAQVSDRPALQVAAPLVGSTSTTLADTSTSAGAPTTTTSTDPDASTSSGQGDTSTTSNPPTTDAAWASQTIQTGGGVVVVRYRNGEVVLGSASPAAGFVAEIKKDGPTEVDVEFESESADYRVRAHWANGALSVETGSEEED